jgi:hypothetical protein
MRILRFLAQFWSAARGKSWGNSWRRSPLLPILLIVLWSGFLGLGVAWALDLSLPTPGTVDPVGEEYQLGQELYLENCATCHIGIPPAVLPGETWRQLLRTTEHYGVVIPPLADPAQSLIWNYLRDFSRGLNQNEATPYRLNDSRYFRALHPRVDVPRPVTLNGCVTCHPGAEGYDFRRLSPEWE